MSNPTLKLFFSPHGRISRLAMLRFGVLYPLGIYTGLNLLSMLIQTAHVIIDLFFIFLVLIVELSVAALSIKRLHDFGRTGYWLLPFILLVTLSSVGISLSSFEFSHQFISNQIGIQALEKIIFVSFGIIFIVPIIKSVILISIPGNKGPNKYGMDPLRNKMPLKEKVV